MPSKHWTLVGGAVACLMAAGSVAAAPWLETGDPRSRFALQKLADRGHLNRPVTTWPAMTAGLQNSLNLHWIMEDGEASGAALSYLNSILYRHEEPGVSGSLVLEGATDPLFPRGYNPTPRENGGVGLSLEWQSTYWAARLSGQFAANPEDDDHWRPDGSYLAAMPGNWVVGAGYIDRWWGPGWQNSLVLSNNARPMPSVWFNRASPDAFETPWLSWIGPWQITVFASRFEEKRHVPDAYLFGMRGTFRPIDGLDIGLTRTFMIGGEGRSMRMSTVWDALVGNDNTSDAGDDPSNQLGAIDIRYGFAVGNQTMGLYAQMMGEDEAGGFPARKSWLLGVDWTSQLWGHDQQWYLEGADTLADRLFGNAMNHVSFEHRVYESGYRYKGRNLAAGVEGDSRALTLGMYNFMPDERQWGASVTWLETRGKGENCDISADREISCVANTFPQIGYAVPAEDQDLFVVSLTYSQPLFAGILDLNTHATSEAIELLSGRQDRWALSARWRYEF